MKLIILWTILTAAVPASLFVKEKEWPWQIGKVYHYDVTSHTVTNFEQGTSNGNGIKTDFLISVQSPGHLLVKLENSKYVPVKANLSNTWELPSGLKYEPFQDLDQIFEIFTTGGRVISVKFDSSLSVTLENVLKGLIGALQVDLTNIGYIHTYPNSYDSEAFQGVFKKVETDVTGSCETLYSVSPMSPEWRREIPKFSSEEDPKEIVKSRNYGNCDEHIGSVSGIPDDAVWPRFASDNGERQFITHNCVTRLLVGKTGTIYKSQMMGTVYAIPLIYGKQKAKVYTHTNFLLNSVSENNTLWQMSKDFRSVNSLLYTDDPLTNFYTRGDQQNIAKAERILQEITPMLQDPNNMSKHNFLMRFNQLVYFLATFSADQLTQLTDSLSEAEFNNIDNMWVVYRNAVALTGTPEAFKQIKYWIFNYKVVDEKAAELITALGASISEPTNALLEDFFHFATCKRVTATKFLNNSAFLASTKLLRIAKDDNFTFETVLPYLSSQLKHAVETGDSKYMVYLTVLGNLAHPAVLDVFAPYFEGLIPVSKNFRIQIVTNLRNLANKKDVYVRSVLYSIIRNTGEPYEVRVAAAQNIFMTFPTFDMMKILAIMAKNDPSAQMRAVLRSGITFAAELKDSRFTVLARTAQAVLDVTPEKKFEYQYSTESMCDGHSSDDEFRFYRELSYIGSNDYFLPKYLKSGMRFMGNGVIDENQRSIKTLSSDVKFGFPTGVMYQFQASSYSTDYKNIEDLLKNDILTTVGNLLYQRDAAHTEINFKYLGAETNVKTVTISLYTSSTCHTLESSSRFENRERCKTVAEIISTGIDFARVKVIDLSAEFKYIGSDRKKYVFTAGYAYNYVNSKYQAGFLANGNQISALLKYDTSKTKMEPLNFENALKNEIEVSYEADFNYEKMNINMKGYGVRSKEFTELLRSEVMAKQCLKEMIKENNYQLDCHKMIVKAHAPDYFKATVTYNFDLASATYHYINLALKKVNSWEVEVNPLETTAFDTLEIESQAFFYENFVNYKLLSKYGQLKLDKVVGLWYFPGIAADGISTPMERTINYYTGYQYLPYCAVDGNKVKTFSGRSYDYTLSSSWHVVMVDRDSDLGRNLAGLVILARRPSLHQLEVYVSLDTGHYKYIELDIKPGNISIKNGNEVTTNGGDNLTTYWYDDHPTPLLEYYSLAEDIKVFSFSNGRIRLVYDQYRLIIFTDGFRSTTKGICGENSGEVRDDYITPWGLVDRPDHYGASFSLDEGSDSKTLALKAEAKRKAYQRVTKLTKIPQYDNEWTKIKPS